MHPVYFATVIVIKSLINQIFNKAKNWKKIKIKIRKNHIFQIF